MTPRVLFVDHSGALGGAELYLLDAVRRYPGSSVVTFAEGAFPQALRDEGHPVEVLSVSAALMAIKKQSGLRSLLSSVPGLLDTVRALVQRARSHDLLFVNSQKALFPGALAGWWAGVPVVWNLHDILTADHFGALPRRAAVTWANAFVDLVIVNSEATRDAFVACGGRRERTRLVYNGIDASAFAPLSASALQALRASLGLDDNPCVGVFSRLAPWKGQHVLLDALSHLPAVHALFVGEALFAGDEPYAAGLRRQAARLGLTDRVHFTGFRTDVPALMQAVDVVAHTSTAPEPFGRVIVEGLLARRPVVASCAGGATEILTDGLTGRLVPPGEPAALARALQDLLSAPLRQQALVLNGERMARRRFSVAAMGTALDAHLREVMKATALPAAPRSRRTVFH